MNEKQKHQVGLDVVESLKSKLDWEHGKHVGVGQSSIDYRIDGDDVVISMQDYMAYISYGTPNPTTPEEIMDWVNDKIMPKVKVKPKGNGATREEIKEKIAENLAKHITKYGPRPYPFIQMMMNNDLPGILKDAEHNP